VLAQQDVFDPAEVLQPRLAAWSEPMAKPVGPVERKQFNGFVPSSGLAAFLEGQHVFPVAALANRHDGLAGVEGVGHQAERQLGDLFLEPPTQAVEALEFIHKPEDGSEREESSAQSGTILLPEPMAPNSPKPPPNSHGLSQLARPLINLKLPPLKNRRCA